MPHFSATMNEHRPWEAPGHFRFDCEPHRSPFLLLLANVSLVCTVFAFLLLLTALISYPLSIAVQLMTRRDLRKMARGQMDPSGQEGTSVAHERARISFVVSTAF